MGSRLQDTSLKKSVSRGSPSQPAKKQLVIKNLKATKLPENFEEETWTLLSTAIQSIYNNNPTKVSLEELYKAVENMCSHKMAASLYSRLQRECEAHIKAEGEKLQGQSGEAEVYLNIVNHCWQEHCRHTLMIRNIFLYLDRTYVISTSSSSPAAAVKNIWEMCIALFRTHVISHADIQRKTVASLLYLIEQERKGETVDRSLLKNLLRMFSSVQLYSEVFEKQFLESTKEFYAAEGVQYLRDSEVADYLKHVETRLHEEVERVLHYLDSSTRKPLILVVEKHLIDEHVDSILSKGFDALMELNRKEDLKRMYALFGRVNALEKLKIQFNTYIKSAGATLISALAADPEKEKTLVQELLDFKLRLDGILEDSFSKNDNFAYALKEAFEHFINLRANKPAELIAKFIDAKLRSGFKGASEEELEAVLDRVMVLFRYIHGKDVFEAFYKKDLAKRLLLGKSASTDAEKSMISKLKSECGASFTSKLEGMFKDIDLSRDIMTAYKQSPRYMEEVELNVHVLTMGYWPPFPQIDLSLPKQLAEAQETFKKFYLSKHSGRRLMWQNSLCHCLVKAQFAHARKELAVSLFQTAVLLLFNDTPSLSFKDIQMAVNLETGELKKTLQSLACGAVHVLNKTPKSKEVSETDSFSVNEDFKHKLHRIQINSIQLKETVEENRKTNENVLQDRQYQIDAAIVRIMKTRKTLAHNLLVTELYNQLKFPVKPVDLKKRIESLIDREYLEREESNSQVYKYLA